MEKKLQNFTRRINNPYFRKSEIRAIVEIWKPTEEGAELKFETDNHVFDSIDELLASSEPAQQITLTRQRKRMIFKYEAVTIRPDQTTIHLANVDNADIGLGTQVEQLILKCRRRLRLGGRSTALLLIAGTILAAVIALGGGLSGRAEQPLVIRILAALAIACLVAGLYGIVPQLVVRNVIKFRPEIGDKKPINLRGAAWQVFILLLGTAVGALCTKFIVQRPEPVLCPPVADHAPGAK